MNELSKEEDELFWKQYHSVYTEQARKKLLQQRYGFDDYITNILYKLNSDACSYCNNPLELVSCDHEAIVELIDLLGRDSNNLK